MKVGDMWKLVLIYVLSNVDATDVYDNSVVKYKEKLKSKVKNMKDLAVVKWRIFGVNIKIRVGVGNDIKDFVCREIDTINADTIIELIGKLKSAAS